MDFTVEFSVVQVLVGGDPLGAGVSGMRSVVRTPGQCRPWDQPVRVPAVPGSQGQLSKQRTSGFMV